MPNDAKLGLVVGVGLVIAIGVVFYRKDAAIGSTAAIDKPAEVQTADRTSKIDESVAGTTSARQHTVKAGETLASLARQYLGDESKATAIRDLNPAIQGADSLSAGTVLILPAAAGKQ
jgi:nucleoid-associated protein YgaU